MNIKPTGKTVEVFGQQFVECSQTGVFGQKVRSCEMCDMNIVECIKYCEQDEHCSGEDHFKRVPSKMEINGLFMMVRDCLTRIENTEDPTVLAAIRAWLRGSVFPDLMELVTQVDGKKDE